mmetsp:Transcript_7677/g.19376  ORF Transcript_7677/g.19376 Transcript_7677/m.19376 type:complete len:615 (-) Transcript_7677:44-1888(-)
MSTLIGSRVHRRKSCEADEKMSTRASKERPGTGNWVSNSTEAERKQEDGQCAPLSTSADAGQPKAPLGGSSEAGSDTSPTLSPMSTFGADGINEAYLHSLFKKTHAQGLFSSSRSNGGAKKVPTSQPGVVQSSSSEPVPDKRNFLQKFKSKENANSREEIKQQKVPETPKDAKHKEKSDRVKAAEEKLYQLEMKKREKMIKLDREKRIWRGQESSNPISSAVWVSKTGQVKERPLVIVDCYRDLPDDVKESVGRMGITQEDVDRHINIMCALLTFMDKRRPKRIFRSQRMLANRLPTNLHPLSMALDESNAFDRELLLRDAKKLFKIKESCGEGGFGAVFRVKVNKRDFLGQGETLPKEIAIKIMPVVSPKQMASNLNEISFLKHCRHENICTLHAALRVNNEVWLLQEYMKGGNLKQASAAKYGVFAESEISYVARELMQGIAYLHSLKIAHRDLKNMNVMLTIEGCVKIIDFGLAADLSHGPVLQMVGSPFWMPPEMIRMEYHSFPADVWSFGICCLELANRVPPNYSNSKLAMYIAATRGLGEDYGLEKPGNWSATFRDFLAKCLTVDQHERATAKELLQHPFFKNPAPKSVMKKKIEQMFISDSISDLGF